MHFFHECMPIRRIFGVKGTKPRLSLAVTAFAIFFVAVLQFSFLLRPRPQKLIASNGQARTPNASVDVSIPTSIYIDPRRAPNSFGTVRATKASSLKTANKRIPYSIVLPNKVSDPLLNDKSGNGLFEGSFRVVSLDENENSAALAALDILQTVPGTRRPFTARLVRRRLEAFRNYIEASEVLPHFWQRRLAASRERGIVVTAGGARPLLNAIAVLHVLHNVHRVHLPIVVAYYGSDELSDATRELFAKHIPDLEFLDLKRTAMDWPQHHLKLEATGKSQRDLGYKLKIWSLYVAPFREVLFLDSDSTPLADPVTLFDLPQYRDHGALFWPDFWRVKVSLYGELGIRPDPWATGKGSSQNVHRHKPKGWDILRDNQGYANSDVSERIAESLQVPLQAESGQIYFNRTRHWKALEYLLFLNTHSSFTYKHSMGDKDTFRAAFALAGVAHDYWQCPFSPALPLRDTGPDTFSGSVRFLNLGMLQLHPIDGSPLFHHRTANSKFEPRTELGENGGPITHVTPPTTQDQAGLMIWGARGATIYGAPGGDPQWGLASEQVRVFGCGTPPGGEELCACATDALHEAEAKCARRSRIEQERDPEPITVIELSKNSPAYRVSREEAEGIALLPFQEPSW